MQQKTSLPRFGILTFSGVQQVNKRPFLSQRISIPIGGNTYAVPKESSHENSRARREPGHVHSVSRIKNKPRTRALTLKQNETKEMMEMRSFFVKFLISWRVWNVVIPFNVGKKCGNFILALKKTRLHRSSRTVSGNEKSSWIREKRNFFERILHNDHITRHRLNFHNDHIVWIFIGGEKLCSNDSTNSSWPRHRSSIWPS
jgi:hypothetical protein